ncbi:MAG TPA: hypothetical protein VGQ36_21430 [Thermoanaerobaculia bacterium]|jgi:hypothetical protein|nr:hypothetical protein [Thermoanaerobaculia bacterium]
MTRRVRQVLLTAIASTCAVLLVIVLRNRELLETPKPPAGLEGSAAWLAEHPADWIVAAAISDEALDAGTPRSVELWHAAYAHAKRLAPYRRNADAAFVRAGFFHWYELAPRNRAQVLKAAAPLMREPEFFARMLVPLWQLTRDFAWLYANAPETTEARGALRDLAVARGLFGEYRVLREDIRARRMKELAAQRASSDPVALLDLVPDRLTAADEPLVRAVLEELDRKPFDPEQIGARSEVLVGYAVRHDIQPLTGILPLLDTPSKLRDVTRARAALDLNNANAATRIEIASAINGAAEWEPYFLDRALFEAKRRQAAAADAYLVRAAVRGLSVPVLAAGEQVAILLNNGKAAEDYRRQLADRAKEPRTWSSSCGANELCGVATRDQYVAGETLRLELTTTQSDETPPYVEIYVDDALRAEGEVRDSRVFEVRTGPGLHTIELRLVNSHTRNGTQRRVRVL